MREIRRLEYHLRNRSGVIASEWNLHEISQRLRTALGLGEFREQSIPLERISGRESTENPGRLRTGEIRNRRRNPIGKQKRENRNANRFKGIRRNPAFLERFVRVGSEILSQPIH